ncbi:NAD(P)H-binding protein [Levilactobacillus brevis]|uniref:NAD(P)H-binding protein n=1 Tax=Levilactobacillus brevis TaxID=1580 RepID=UPI001CDB3C0F|nr:NAD(P)H-binding protein [Levilactobacillus brevis]
MMKTVLVIGATSPTAQAFIALMARDYPEVNLKLFVRNLKKVPAQQRQKYDVFLGNASKYTDYVASLKNVDYIYDSVGGLSTGPYVKLLLRAIKEAQAPIKRIVDISAGGIYGEYLSGNLPYLSAVRVQHPQYTHDQLDKPTLFKNSGIPFTIFRPGLIQDGPETKIITHGPEFRTIPESEFAINRDTFARAAANALFNDDYHNQSVSISNGKAL